MSQYQLITALGLRVYPNRLGQLRLPEGSFGRDRSGRWMLRPPTCDTLSLPAELVSEHTDGTISVRGLIQTKEVSFPRWLLERGIWINLDAQEIVQHLQENSL